jgi:hypothetical protein
LRHDKPAERKIERTSRFVCNGASEASAPIHRKLTGGYTGGTCNGPDSVTVSVNAPYDDPE